jgi:hypothetical protein
LFNRIYERGALPHEYKEGFSFNIHINGHLNILSNYIGIIFNNATNKIFTYLLLECLDEWSDKNNLVKEFQARFRKGYSTVDNICTLTSFVKNRYSGKRNEIYVFLCEFSGGLDRVDRRAPF